MKKVIVVTIMMLFVLNSMAQTKIKGIKKIDNGLYVMYYDTTHQKRIVTKSLIVEFKKYIALLEMPISNDGSGTTVLTDHSEGGAIVLNTLNKYFPNKPLKYILSTHWHPHSISSILPFVSRGITLITTANNFKMLTQFVDSAAYKKYKKNIVFVDDNGMTIGDKNNKIEIYKLNKKDYPNIPTEDFLFFYMPRYNCLHNSCMFQRFASSKVMGKELVSVRVEDLNKFLSTHQLAPKYLITTDTYWDEPGGYVLGDTLRKMMKTGIGMGALANEILNFDVHTITNNSDSVLKYLMDNRVPYSILNIAVYDALKTNKLDKALAIARLQVLINPSSANSWDTYGEVYYFMGEMKMAKKYEAASKQIDKSFDIGGEKIWEKDFETFRTLWK